MSRTDVGAFVCMACVAAVYSCVAIAAIPRAAHTCTTLGCQCWHAFLRWCRTSSARESGKDSDRERNLHRQRIAKIRCDYLSDVANAGLHLCGIVSVLSFVRHLFALVSASHPFGLPLADSVMATLIVASYIVSSLIRIRPQLLNENTLAILHSFYMGVMMCYSTYEGITGGGSRYALGEPRWVSLFVILCLAYPEPLPNFFWSVVWATTRSVVYLQPDAEQSWIEPGNVITKSLTTAGFLWLVLTRFRQLQVSYVETELEAKGHLRAKQTVEKVLADMCDAVVQLNRQMIISKPCARLAGLLFKNISTTGLSGEAFPSMLLTDVDRERFENFITPRTMPVEQDETFDGEERPSSVYVRLRDADGIGVSVQVFHSCHDDPPSDVCHVLGVREVQDHDRDDMGGQQMLSESAWASGGNQNDDTASVCSSVSSAATNGGNVVLAPLIPDNRMVDPVSALVNPTTMEIVGCTIGFKSFTGPLIFKGAIRDIIGNYGSTFRAWMQQEVYGRTSNTEPSEPSRFEIKLKPATVREQQRVEFRGEAYVVDARLDAFASDMGLEPSGDDEEFYDALCVLALRNLESRAVRAGRKGQHRNRANTEGPLPARHGMSL